MTEEKTSPRKRHLDRVRGASRHVVHFVEFAILAVIVLVAAAFWRLSQGPVSLTILTPYVEQALARDLPALDISFGDTVLIWEGWDGQLDVRVRDVTVVDRDGRGVIAAPEVAVAFGPRALMAGRIAIVGLELIGPELVLIRTSDGTFGFQGSAADDGASPTIGMEGTLVDLLKGGDAGQEALDRLSVVDARVRYRDEATGTSWSAHEANIFLRRKGSVINGAFEFAIELGVQRASISGFADYMGGTGRLEVSLNFADLEPAALSRLMPDFKILDTVRFPLSGTARFDLENGGELAGIWFDLDGGAGTVDLPGIYPAPLAVDRVTARGRVGEAFRSLVLDEFVVHAGPMTVQGDGDVALSPAGMRLDVDGTMSGLELSELPRFWPPQVAAGGLRWVREHVSAGQVTAARFHVAISPEMIATNRFPDDAAILEFAFEDLVVDYLPPMTAVTTALGHGRVTPSQFDLTIERASVGPLALSEGTLKIPNLDQQDHFGHIEFVISGPVADQLRLVDSPPLALVRKVGIDPDQTGGKAATRVQLTVPLKASLRHEQVTVAAASNIHDGRIDDIFRDFDITDGQLTLRVDQAALEVGGDMRFGGIAVRARWIQHFDAKDDAPAAQYQIAGRLDEAGRQAFGAALAPWLRGPIDVDARIDAYRGGDLLGEIRLDLTPAAINLGPLGIAKAADAPGSLAFHMVRRSGDPPRLNNISLKMPDAVVSGRVELTPAGGVREVRIDRLEGGQNSFGAVVEIGDDGTYEAAITGERVDFRPLIDQVWRDDGVGVVQTPFRVTVQSGEAILRDELRLSGFQGEAYYDGTSLNRLVATGTLGADAAFNARLAPDGDRRRFEIHAEDAGQLVRGLGIYENLIGGAIRIEGAILDNQAEERVDGRIEMANFKLVRAPVLTRILTVGSLTGISDLLSGEGITFASAVIPLRRTDDLIEVQGARAAGPALGLTAQGTIDLETTNSELGGTIVPAYTLNSVLGNIPLLGQILVPEGEGVFGITYRVEGPIEDPAVSVNPLSALAPGILRRMFFPAPSSEEEAGEPLTAPNR